MSACDRVETLLSAYLEREASPAEVRFVDGHLTVCRRCRDLLEETAALLERLPRLPRTRVSPGFTDRVLAEVRNAPAAGLEVPVVPMPRPAIASWAAPLAAAAAVAVALLGIGRLTAPASSLSARAPAVSAPAPDLDQRLAHDVAAMTVRDAAPGPSSPLAGLNPPPVASLTDLRPDLAGKTEAAGEPLGMAGDAYVLEDWMLREPAGGGRPVLTRVGADPAAKVMVTF